MTFRENVSRFRPDHGSSIMATLRNLASGSSASGHTKITGTIHKLKHDTGLLWPSPASVTPHDQHKRLCGTPCAMLRDARDQCFLTGEV